MKIFLLALLCLCSVAEAKPVPKKPQGPTIVTKPVEPVVDVISKDEAIKAIEAIRVEAQAQLKRADELDVEIGHLKDQLREADAQAGEADIEALAAAKREVDLRQWGIGEQQRADKAEAGLADQKVKTAKAEKNAILGWSCFGGLLALLVIAFLLRSKLSAISPF